MPSRKQIGTASWTGLRPSGAGRAGLWVVVVVTGSLVASLLAIRLHRRLTPEQDGRGTKETAAPEVPTPVSVSANGVLPCE